MNWINDYGLNNWIKLINGIICIIALLSSFNYKEKHNKYGDSYPVLRWRLSLSIFFISLVFAMYLNDVGIHSF